MQQQQPDLLITDEAIKAEQAVLGAIFIKQEAMDDISFLEPRDFLTQTHENMFKVMRYLNDYDKPIDFITVAEAYMKHGRMDDMGGISYLNDLAASSPTASNIKHYANIVRSKAVRRRAIDTADTIKMLSKEKIDNDEEFFNQIETMVSDLRPKEHGKLNSIASGRTKYMQHLQNKNNAIRTGFHQFDNWSGGVPRGNLYISAGRPSAGKTALMLERAMGVAKQHEGAVLIFSQEMNEEELKDRMIANLANISFGRFQRKLLTDKELVKVDEAHERLESLPLYIQDTAAVSIDEVRSTAREFKRTTGNIAMICVDYLQIMHIPQTKEESRAAAIGKVTRRAKTISRELNCCFMMLAQMNRGSEQKEKPTLADLKESGNIEEDADVVEFLWFDKNDVLMGEHGTKVVQQLIAKGRNIGINEFRLKFKGFLMRFEEIEKEKVS